MLKKLLLVVSLLLLVAPPVRADAVNSNYDAHSTVGFTGKWETPPTNTTTPNEPPKVTTLANTANKSFPKTGDGSFNSVLVSTMGVLFLALVLHLVLRRRKEAEHNL